MSRKKGATGKRGRPAKNFKTKAIRVHEDVYTALKGRSNKISEEASKVLASVLGVDLEQ